jgi:hypothetical protein
VMAMDSMPRSETGLSLGSSAASASLTSDTKRPPVILNFIRAIGFKDRRSSVG